MMNKRALTLSGIVWFLKKLFNGENGSEIILSRDNNDGLILHDAANCREHNILFMMVEEFPIDPKLKDGHGKTPLHVLANLAQNDIWIWDSVKSMLQRYSDEGLATILQRELLLVRLIQKRGQPEPAVLCSRIPEKNIVN